MDYQYENLGDERFQEFCHCIINKEFPNTQAFPVGQPDGGRDSVAFLMSSIKKEFVVFQVKFVRNPKTIKDVHKWLMDTISGEIDKINKLIPKGAKNYYLLTNVKGTAHLDAGSIDKVNKILEENISIPSLCWWGDDLSRKIESDPMFKWSFPEILNGQDILNSALFQNLNEHKERRENTINSYLADQYEWDNKVKFRQIDLQNSLFDLFTDVPVRVNKFNEKNNRLKQTLSVFNHSGRKISHHLDDLFFYDKPDNIGAAEFLLNPMVQNGIERILLEGGPGQGKSTISQFICQVHRARLLEKEKDIKLIDKNLTNTPVRIPFKVDLRHVASWVEKKNPYKDSLNNAYFEENWNNSLEAFLVSHIFYHSKNKDFTSNDLIAISKLSQILIVFDGFDEIANLDIRAEVVEFINKGLNRLSQNCKSIQVLITSRPVAFSDKIGFSVDHYPHFELTDITPTLIREYVEKWVKANKLNDRETAEIKKLVEEKLKLPHLRDLAKSPMQLAIFISLLRTKGEALPNKRTALYDSYINLFFDREVEKNAVIKNHRDLIIDIHQYLAWVLHFDSELNNTTGIIQEEDLKKYLTEYLEKEGHATNIADIFMGVERVCALVSRVKGTYEFEVQPLREYFCARHLYTTAPPSIAGYEKAGSKADRFEAISSNFYWQNVLRFFAGCFDKGELPMITQELNRLSKNDLTQFTNFPYLLASQLLSDYVFAQSPRNQKDIISLVVNRIKSGNLTYEDRRRSDYDRITLPAECGGNAIADECFNQLKNFPKDDYASELISLIDDNPYNKEKFWKEHAYNIRGKQLTKWFEYAEHLRILEKIDAKTIEEILENDDKEFTERLKILIKAGRLDILDKNLKFKKEALKGILNRENIVLPMGKSNNHSMKFLTTILHPFLLSLVIDQGNLSISYIKHLQRRFPIDPFEDEATSFLEFQVGDETDKKALQFLERIKSVIIEENTNWSKNVEPWDTLVESGRDIFGECWGLDIVAVISSGIKSRNYFKSYSDLNDKTKSLCKRVRYVRMKSGNIKYWKEKLQDPTELKLLIFFTWATPKTICNLLPILSSIIVSLSEKEFLKLVNGISATSRISMFTKSQQETIESAIRESKISDSLIYLLSNRIRHERRGRFVYKYIQDYTGIPDDTLQHSIGYLIKKFLDNPSDKKTLSELKDQYKEINNFHPRFYHYYYENRESVRIPLDISKSILEDSGYYPREIIALAQISFRTEANKNIKPVGKIAKEEKWFDQ